MSPGVSEFLYTPIFNTLHNKLESNDQNDHYTPKYFG